jgi:hypothetical protein
MRGCFVNGYCGLNKTKNNGESVFNFGSRKSDVGGGAPCWTIILSRLRTWKTENVEGAGCVSLNSWIAKQND